MLTLEQASVKSKNQQRTKGKSIRAAEAALARVIND
jgi:hypothetical protein